MSDIFILYGGFRGVEPKAYKTHVVCKRGGSWFNALQDLRSITSRFYTIGRFKVDTIGFRCVKNA